MQVREIMSNEPKVVPPDCSVPELARKMRDEDLGAVPICDGDRILGMVTDRDIVTRAVALDKPLKECSARDVMSDKIAYVQADDDVEKAEKTMSEHQIRRLPVIDQNKKLVGMVSVADLARKANRNADWALEGIVQPGGQARKM